MKCFWSFVLRCVGPLLLMEAGMNSLHQLYKNRFIQNHPFKYIMSY